ncbi:MAG TPA: FHA domain-containing protein [Pyrinomonadaceae bacterium]|nr:FHA domain-containing protein [Pyrinomonadaceae bacterium]
MEKPEKKEAPKKRDEALVERLMHRVLEGFGAVVDRKLGREADAQATFTTSKLIERMKRLIEERARPGGAQGRIAPHHLKLKVEWGKHSEAPTEYIKELEHEVVAAAVDYINDQRMRTLAPVSVETVVDIFTSGITVDPTFGEFEERIREEDEARRREAEGVKMPPVPHGLAPPPSAPKEPRVEVTARVTTPDGTREAALTFKPGGRRVNVGRIADNDLALNHPSVSKIHAALTMNREGTLLVADTGSTNGTYINGRRLAYGEARQIEEGDVVGFGDVEVRFKKAVNSES